MPESLPHGIVSIARAGPYLFAGASDLWGVFRNSGSGTGWLSLEYTSLLSDQIKLVSSGSAIVGATSDVGVIVSTDFGETWQPKSAGLTAPYLSSITIQNGIAVVGTHGGFGTWRRSLNQLVTSVDVTHDQMPKVATLLQNYPNPFNPTTTIKFQIAKEGLVSLRVFDVLGREVRTVVNEVRSAGIYEEILDASSLASGTYFYRLLAGNYVATKKLVLL